MSIAIIPARGGSQRIPGKNIRNFCGKPMIQWSIEAAVASACFDRIVVSTDDPRIAAVAVGAGAEAPFVRPASLSDAHTGTAAVVAHAIDWLASSLGETLDARLVCCIYATAPFVIGEDIARGQAALRESGADYALAVSEFAAPVQRALVLDAAGRLRMLYPEHAATRSQDLLAAYHDAGQFCWGRGGAWRSGAPVLQSTCVAVPVPRDRVNDIDTEQDWRIAEQMWAAAQRKAGEP